MVSLQDLITNRLNMKTIKGNNNNNKGETMEVSKLTLTDEFIQKTKKKLSPQEKGKMRWERLMQAEKDGTLQKAKKRIDVGRIAGVLNDANAYAWIANLVGRGAIIEIPTGFENGKATYEYHLGKPLNYDTKTRKVPAIRNKVQASTPAQNSKQVSNPVKVEYNSENKASITITVNNIVLTIENANVEYLVALIRELAK